MARAGGSFLFTEDAREQMAQFTRKHFLGGKFILMQGAIGETSQGIGIGGEKKRLPARRPVLGDFASQIHFVKKAEGVQRRGKHQLRMQQDAIRSKRPLQDDVSLGPRRRFGKKSGCAEKCEDASTGRRRDMNRSRVIAHKQVGMSEKKG